MYVCLLSKSVELYHSATYFAVFLISLQILYQRNGDSKSCACYKLYGVDKLNDNWNSYEKESTRPKSTRYLPSVENMVAYILTWLAIIFMSKVFVKHVFSVERHPIFKQILQYRCTRRGRTGLMVLCLGKDNISIQSGCLKSHSLVAHNNMFLLDWIIS